MCGSIFFRFLFAILLIATFCICVVAQIDEISEATGIPIAIGQPVIYGQVAIEGMPKGERRPNVFVVLTIGGSQVDRRQTNDRGYYFFLKQPTPGYVLVVEVDGAELGRANLITGIGGRVKQDFAIDWRMLRGSRKELSGGVSQTDSYSRTENAEKAFDKAMKALNDQKLDEAKNLFSEIVQKEPADYFAWTLLGTVQFEQNEFELGAQSIKKALLLKPDFLLGWINMAKLELSRKNIDAAINAGIGAVERHPNSSDANHLLGEALLQAKKGSLAVGFLNRAIELAPIAKAEIHLRLAALYDGAGDRDRAAVEYKLFLTKIKDHPDRKMLEKYIKENSRKK